MRLSSTQIASRQVINKDLPTFSGKPEEWPLFITSFEQSTEQCGFTDSENLIRLQRCLKGVALEAVRGKLMAPATVWQAIETLRMLYGRPDIICHSLQRKLRQEPLVRYDNLETLIQFALAVQNYCCTLKAIGLSSYLNDPMLLSELLCKLPSDLKLEWGRYKVSLLHADISEFDYWLFKLATCASQVVSVSSSADEVKVNNNQFKKRVLVHGVVHTNSATSSQPYRLQCSGDHRLEKCKQFCDLSTNDRWCFVRDNKLCIRCFRKHFLKNCPLHCGCGIDGCTKPHHVLLHSNYSVNPSHKAAVMLHKEEHATKTLLRYVPVILYGKSKCIKTYALIDEGSTCTLLEKHIAEELGLDGPSDELCLRWTDDITQVEPKSKCVTIGLSSTHETSPRFNLRNIRTVANLDLPKQSLLQEVLSSHSHLHNLPIEPYAGVRATLLLGVDNAKIGVPLKVKEIEGDQLIATKCRLGWSVYGRGEGANALSNRVMHICSCVSTERMDEMLKANYALEAVGISMKDEPLKSKADERALAIMQSTTKYLENEKRWETGLLWKFDKIDLPNSYSMALQRLSCLEKRMTRDPLLRNFLNKKIREYEDKGYIRKLTKDEISHGKRSWFIPIFTVTNKNKNKTRLVWDAAATVDGIALNTYLMKGPDLLASLVGILIRFRERAFAITGDIREMFHQIRVRSKDQTAQQFLWPHGNSSRDPAAAYLRATVSGKVKCCLVASKSRVAPLKPVSIPRLELMGAILGLRLAKFIRNELTLPISEEVYWTDSKNVLHWIRSDTRKFSQFVGVRIGDILELSSINNWRWVPSADNVADDATKLKQWSKLDGELRWFQGPQFLTLPSWEWPETILVNSAEHDLVHHIELNTTLSFTSFTEVVPHVSRFSKWEKLRGATRCALRFLRLVSRRPGKSEFVQMMLQDTTVNSAEVLIVLMCQSETF
ncbi:uncharacterized protein LOC129251289 [Anastrepha obliqua]|uniref:uncharacterized protein LOC129251289 n=1 Tax=Anastrepha obliqua TaxID=95512 RepID=UPI002409DD56|nr:uncharacterized protein LOC129251289 [Anastrepha obliqua]